MVKGVPKNHVPWSRSSDQSGWLYDGQGDSELLEPSPEYFTRPGDEKLVGQNNTAIILGRDVAPDNKQAFSTSIKNRQYNSGYSDHMGAGAIDIVAGLMSPFPIEKLGDLKDIVVSPAFNTSFPPELQDLDLTNGKHPGMHMDAARIYISQMTNIDENFLITKDLYGDESSDPLFRKWDKTVVVPTSGIMLKADKVRLHSRQDIKIVTGGPNELYNSQGNRIKQNNGIHLIAENGIDRDNTPLPQHPIPLGNNLVRALDSMTGLISDVVGALDAMTEAQIRFNNVVANHFHLAAPGYPTMPDIVSSLQGIITMLEHITKTRLGCIFQDVNIFMYKANYLNPISTNYINSRHNTVN